MPIETISLLIAFAGVCLALLNNVNSARHDSARNEGRMSEIMTKLDFIGDDIKDMKASYRSLTNEIQAVRDLAIEAQESAASAHKRLDRAGIDLQDKGQA